MDEKVLLTKEGLEDALGKAAGDEFKVVGFISLTYSDLVSVDIRDQGGVEEYFEFHCWIAPEEATGVILERFGPKGRYISFVLATPRNLHNIAASRGYFSWDDMEKALGFGTTDVIGLFWDLEMEAGYLDLPEGTVEVQGNIAVIIHGRLFPTGKTVKCQLVENLHGPGDGGVVGYLTVEEFHNLF